MALLQKRIRIGCMLAVQPGCWKLCHTCAKRIRLPHQLSWEAHIRCGMGLCGHCECADEEDGLPPGWLVCQDGPVQIVSY